MKANLWLETLRYITFIFIFLTNYAYKKSAKPLHDEEE